MEKTTRARSVRRSIGRGARAARLLCLLLVAAGVTWSRPARSRRRRCRARRDITVPLKYKDGGQVWIPREAACGGRFPVLVLLHGNNPYGRLHKYIGGGKNIDRIVRRYLDKRLIEPVVLAEPIHHAVCKREEERHGLELLWGGSFSFRTYRRLLLRVLRKYRIRAKSWSLIGHSGAGCCPSAGLFAAAKVWRRLKIWATADTCYENPKTWLLPIQRFRGTSTILYNSCRGEKFYPGYREYARHMFTRRPRKVRCDRHYYKECVRHPHRRWYGFVVRTDTVPGHGPVVTELIKTIVWRHFPSRWRRLARLRRLKARRRRR